MTKTLAEIITIVRFRGDMRNSVRFPDANLTSEIQAAFAEGYELVVEQNSGFYDTTGNVVTVAGTAFSALPATAWVVRAVDRVDGTDFEPLPRVGVKDRNRYGTTRGRPVAHRLTARGIDLYPTPDAVYTLRVTYTPVAPTLSATPTEFYNSWEEYTIFGALVRLYTNMGRDASEWQRQLDRQAQRIVRAASDRSSGGPEYLNLHDGGDGGEDDDRWRPGF
jgi:hypothetical protein